MKATKNERLKKTCLLVLVECCCGVRSREHAQALCDGREFTNAIVNPGARYCGDRTEPC